VKKVLNDMPFPKGLILEIGCASGNFFNILRNKNFKNNRYIGIDLDSRQIEKARSNFPKEDFICGNVLDDKFNKLIKSANIIVSFEVLEHIDLDKKLFNKIKSNTPIIFSVPNFKYRSTFPDGHKRWFDLDGWIDRYKDIIDISEVWSIKHYKKDRKIFVFQSTRR